MNAKRASEVRYIDRYMESFYDSLTQENLEIGMFLREASTAARAVGHKRVLDVGCGPSMLYWALFLDAAEEYHGLDVREDNMDSLRQETAEGLSGKMHPRYRDVSEHMLRMRGEVAHPEHFFISCCRRFRSLTAYDLQDRWPCEDGSMSVVMSVFGLDHVDSPEGFLASLREVRRVLEPGGRFVYTTLCETSSWSFEGEEAMCLHTTKESLEQDLQKAGFTNIHVERRAASTAVERDQGYKWMLFGWAE